MYIHSLIFKVISKMYLAEQNTNHLWLTNKKEQHLAMILIISDNIIQQKLLL